MALHIVNGIDIRTDFVYPPIPIRTCDWSATVDGYEPGEPIGYGRTEAEAIAELLVQLADAEDNRADEEDRRNRSA